MRRKPTVIARHELRLWLRTRRSACQRQAIASDVKDFLLAYAAGLLAFGIFLA